MELQLTHQKKTLRISGTVWPPSSPDLNQLDYSVWSTVEAKACQTSHKNLDDLRPSIAKALGPFEKPEKVECQDPPKIGRKAMSRPQGLAEGAVASSPHPLVRYLVTPQRQSFAPPGPEVWTRKGLSPPAISKLITPKTSTSRGADLMVRLPPTPTLVSLENPESYIVHL